MITRNGSNKLQFDPIAFVNLLITVVVIMGGLFTFYLTAIEGRFDAIEKIDTKQTIVIEQLRVDISEIKDKLE